MSLSKRELLISVGLVGAFFLLKAKKGCCSSSKPSAPAAAASDDVQNVALIFIKPHGQTDKMAPFVEQQMQVAGLTIVRSGTIPGKRIDASGSIDSHYAAIGEYAMKTAPANLPLGADKKKEFEAKFGDNFDAAAASGKIINAAAAMQKFSIDGVQIGKEFEAAKVSTGFKLAPGMYVVFLKERGVYVINGFYGTMRAEYVDPRAVVTWYVVAWSERALSWAAFRGEVLGATDPTAASPNSIRAAILKSHQAMNLPFVPSTGKNCLHGSASPLEAFHERRIWTGASTANDVFGMALLQSGVSQSKIDWFCTNPSVGGKPLFDIVEDTNTTECLASLVGLAKE